MVLAEVVDPADLVQVLWVSIASGLGVMLVFSLAIYGSTRYGELRRAERDGAAIGMAVLTAISLLATAAIAFYGIYSITAK